MNCLNQTGDEKMCCRGNLVERDLLDTGIILPSIESLSRLGKDLMLMLQSYLILTLIIAPRLDSKASKSGSSPFIVCAVLRISNSILKLQNVSI